MRAKTSAAVILSAAVLTGCIYVGHGVASVAGYLQPVREKDWEPVRGYSVFSWHQSASLIPEQTKDHIHHRSYRFRADGKVTSHTRETLNQLAASLLAAFPDLNRYRIPGRSFDNKAYYFIDKRLYMVSVDPPVLVLVPAKFIDSGGRTLPQGGGLTHSSTSHSAVMSAYCSFYRKEFAIGIKHKIGRLDAWINYIEFSSVIPKAEGIEAVSHWWSRPVPLRVALADKRWNFHLEESRAFPGYLELSPSGAQPFTLDP